MDKTTISFINVDDYINSFPNEINIKLTKIRNLVHNIIPEATVTIKYNMPTFEYHGNLVHFAAYKNHIGFYPSPSGIIAFKEDIKPFKNSKGAIQFPINKDLPLELIEKIVRFRIEENKLKQKSKLKSNQKL
jgi:uncharacterized protein YdhG (YjbR/CyaY superfamily)